MNTRGLNSLKSLARMGCACLLGAALCAGACGCAASSTSSAASSASSSAGSAQKVSSSDVQAASEALSTTLDKITACDESTCVSVLRTVWFYPEDYGVSPACFANAYFAGFSYAVDTATAEEGRVIVSISATVHPAEETLASLGAAYETAKSAGADMSQEGASDSFFTAYVAASPFTAQDVKMDVVMVLNSEGAWSMRDSNAFASFLLGGLNPMQDAS